MSTKPPAGVQPSSPTSLEKIAYNSVSMIPTQEPNDQHRLGYHIWRWLGNKQGTLEEAVLESGARLKISAKEAANIISDELAKQGQKVS